MVKHLQLLFIIFGCFLSVTVLAHGDLDLRIAEATKEIETAPDSTFLYFKRAKLYFQHEEFEKAIFDLDQAAARDYQDLFCNLIYAKSYLQLKLYDTSLKYAETIQNTTPNNVNAYKIKAQVFFEQKKYKAAAENYEAAIEHSRKTFPENYLNAAKSWELANAPDEAILILEEGVKELGPLFTLYEQMRNIHVKNNDLTNALNIQNEIIDAANRKEIAYQKAGEICLQFNQPQKAKTYLQKSLKAIEELPSRIQLSPSVAKLKRHITTQIQNI